MLLNAMEKFQVAKREYSEAQKEQYSDKGDVKNWFRASEMGYSDRKIIYGFFKHQLPVVPKGAKNLRQLENGDYVHERYQKAWEDMGALISMEERLSSREDDYLGQFPWEWAGHYDGYLDINVLRAHALGYAKLGYAKNPETEQWEIEVELDEEYAKTIGIFEEDYAPLPMVADIKTMNPWGFKRIKEKGNLEEIQGYIDQISFYMYMLNTPYGSIYIEAKDNNDVVEVQVVWKDMHEDVEYTFDPDIHGELTDGVVRVTIDNDRFFGSEDSVVEGLVPRINKLWEIKEKLFAYDLEGNTQGMAELMPPRCSEDASKFPCSWGNGLEKCEYFDHCWNQYTQGLSIRAYEACPDQFKWDITDRDNGEILEIDSRKVPQGVTQEALQALYTIGAIEIERFLIDKAPVPIKDVVEEASHADILSASGELNLGAPAPASEGEAKPVGNEALEYLVEGGKKAIKCLKCGKEVVYTKLANGGTKKCEYCNHVNKVVR